MGQESIVAFNLRSILCVPLKVKNDLIGVIYADNRIRTGIFAESERNLLVAFANQAAVAIENARLFSSLKHTLEEVTGLKNLMDNIFASIASGVITADIQNQITLTNRAAETILGSASNDIIGHLLNETLASVSKELEPHLMEVRETDKAIADLEISHISPTRGNVDWRFNLSPLKDAGQKTQGVAIVLDDLTERKKLEAQRRLFERMVSPAVIEQLDPNSLQLGGKRTDITALFADIRGFTTFSESQEPEQLVKILNRYLAAMADAVLAQEGTIDKFMGDAIMAWFNAPIPQPDHTLRAVKTALIIRESIENLYKELPAECPPLLWRRHSLRRRRAGLDRHRKETGIHRHQRQREHRQTHSGKFRQESDPDQQDSVRTGEERSGCQTSCGYVPKRQNTTAGSV